MVVTFYAMVLAAGFPAEASAAASQPAAAPAQSVSIQLTPGIEQVPRERERTFTARFTPEELKLLLAKRSDVLPLPFEFDDQREAFAAALDRISMQALVEKLKPFITGEFSNRFDVERDLIVVPVPPEQQLELEVPELPGGRYRGPTEEVMGFLVHEVTEREFISTAIRLVQTARQMLDTGKPVFDRSSPGYFELLARQEAAKLIEARQQEQAREKETEAVRRRIGEELGVYDPHTGKYEGEAAWVKESRRFTYIVQEGRFIDRLRPAVERINRDLERAGFAPPRPLDRAGIHFDADLRDVELLLPRPMMERFLEQADRLEQRMAEDHMISIEAVRLTDRDIINGAIASRLSVLSQGVHDVRRFNTKGVFRHLGINALLAVANRELQVSTIRAIEAGTYPEGVDPITIAPPELPPLFTGREATTVGGDFSVGADDIFFDGRQQTYGFSYIGPDGLQHTLSLEVVDSLREFWDRIERNLIVHKIKKTKEPQDFTVPVGPKEKTFKGIAALISQENQELVVATGTGALSTLSATAGTWLVIQDFEIEPTPGSSTALTEEERRAIEDRVLLTMVLRDGLIDVEAKARLLEAGSEQELADRLGVLYDENRSRPVRPGAARTFGAVYEQRYRETLEEAAIEKKEKNSTITLTFYSSQGNIIQLPGATALGDANDLTSFTTELRPNVATPISSFFTKSAGGAKGSSPLTGVAKGEQSNEEKTMTHLVVRARFPTVEREQQDLQEGRHLGYFELPFGRIPHSVVDLPFLSSSEHPLDRLSKLRVGLTFDALRRERVKEPLALINPNSLTGTVPLKVWETATTRLWMNRRIISDSPRAEAPLAAEYRRRFVIEVRSLLEFDEDFFNAPNMALRSMAQWNDPDRIVLALNNSTGKFALERLILIIDELGEELVPQEYADDFLARSPSSLFGGHKVYPLSQEELRTLRRDVANHYLRFQEAYGDAFLEAVSMILELGTYRAAKQGELLAGPFRGYQELVVFDDRAMALADRELFEWAHGDFLLLKQGGYKGRLFEPSLLCLEHLPREHRKFIVRGGEILERGDW